MNKKTVVLLREAGLGVAISAMCIFTFSFALYIG